MTSFRKGVGWWVFRFDHLHVLVCEILLDTVLQRVTRADSGLEIVRAIFRFDRRLPNLSDIFRKNWETMVQDDRRLLGPFPSPPMICYTRGKNLREELCRAKIPRARLRRGEEPGFRRCTRPACRRAPSLVFSQGRFWRQSLSPIQGLI